MVGGQKQRQREDDEHQPAERAQAREYGHHNRNQCRCDQHVAGGKTEKGPVAMAYVKVVSPGVVDVQSGLGTPEKPFRQKFQAQCKRRCRCDERRDPEQPREAAAPPDDKPDKKTGHGDGAHEFDQQVWHGHGHLDTGRKKLRDLEGQRAIDPDDGHGAQDGRECKREKRPRRSRMPQRGGAIRIETFEMRQWIVAARVAADCRS